MTLIEPNLDAQHSNDARAIAGIVFIHVKPDGKSDPQQYARQVSDVSLQKVIVDSAKLTPENSESAAIAQWLSSICKIEWAFRNQFLEGDWKWQWDGADQGKILFKPKMPLNDIPFPQ